MMRPQPASAAPQSRPPRPPTHHLDVFSESSFAKDVAKCLLHTIFFHRLFPAVRPLTRDVVFVAPTTSNTNRIQAFPSHPQHTSPYALEPPTITHPLVDDADIETEISERATQLTRSLERTLKSDPSGQVKKSVSIHFYEKKRKKASTGFAGFWKEPSSASEANGVRWESWDLAFLVQQAKVGRKANYAVEDEEDDSSSDEDDGDAEALVRKSVKSLRKAMMDVIQTSGDEKEHIPPITSADTNPFPFEIIIDGGK
ncbi:MAG: hypothetical protein Q9162_003256 [Coniocarpon cinnabarinum]